MISVVSFGMKEDRKEIINLEFLVNSLAYFLPGSSNPLPVS